MTNLRAKAEFYKSKISDEVFTKRCDKLAFKPYLSNSGLVQDLSGFEDNGRWSRDVEPCYPEFSGGTISFDGLVAVMHHIWTTKDEAMLDRFIVYSESHAWIVGEGTFADQTIMSPLSYQMKAEFVKSRNLNTTQDITNMLKGFRGHLLASLIWLEGRMNGSLNELEMTLLTQLYQVGPDDPMYVGLYHRFTDGDQTKTIEILLKSSVFPNDHLPMEDGVFGWGSSPASIYYLICIDVIEGR